MTIVCCLVCKDQAWDRVVPFASKPAPTRYSVNPVGAGLLAKRPAAFYTIRIRDPSSAIDLTGSNGLHCANFVTATAQTHQAMTPRIDHPDRSAQGDDHDPTDPDRSS
ncbi:hypothetical protein C1X65_08695 [Pseudomonas sp. FW305-70]|nr:hypothetical protein C1X65_08695 [Pseudomonas sp. FW305-70]